MSGNERPKYDASRDEQPDALPPHSPLGDVALLTRREFVAGALASTLLPDLRASTWLDQAKEETPLRPTKIGEIASTNGRLRAVITVRNEDRRIAADPNVNMPERTAMLRYFEGKDADGNVVWPPPGSAGALRSPLPGPTLRAQLGDQIEITYLNQIDVSQFPKGTIDLAETGELTPCAPTKDTEGVKLYPEGAGDHFPNCFHGSSTVNMHFHGTHVTPDGLGDNVLLQLRPRPDITEAAVRQDFERIFAAGPPGRWSDLPRSWQEKQLRWLKEYDDTAVWQGVRGTPGHPALPPANRLLPRAQAFIANGYWPQYQVGAYPFCFKITEYSEDAAGRPVHYAMGQCPGTHWYHAHKHGSTAINVLNGMAGVFIIEGGYDAALKKLYPDLKRTEQVLIVQNFSDRPNLLSQVVFGQAPSLWVNGELSPTVEMRPGEIQLWRLVNASPRAVTTLEGFDRTPGNPEIRQLAQDGVQFSYENYHSQPILQFLKKDEPRPNSFAPGNRIDILVRAPVEQVNPGGYDFVLEDTTNGSANAILRVVIRGEAIVPPMDFPFEAGFPEIPKFLKDIQDDEVRIRRRLDFGWERGRTGPGLKGAAPKFLIDDQQFSDGRYNQTMIMGDAEEWTLTNATNVIAHPFHIHVNPFQVLEVHDPVAGTTYKQERNGIWQDVIAIPPARFEGDKMVERGYVRIRHRFVDFTGSYVLHCHMLAHEDRGMMQLVRVISGSTLVEHH